MLSRGSTWLALSLLFNLGCAGPVVANLSVRPPEPAPRPTGDEDTTMAAATSAGDTPQPVAAKTTDADEDGDGIKSPDDRCPEEAETKNGFEDDDGCPDTPPDYFVGADHRVVYAGKIGFAFGGTLASSSDATIRGIADALKKTGPVKVDVGVHVSSGSVDDAKKRAVRVVDALVKQGLPRSSLTASGYGKKCVDRFPAGRRVVVTVVEKNGQTTAAKLGCAAER